MKHDKLTDEEAVDILRTVQDLATRKHSEYFKGRNKPQEVIIKTSYERTLGKAGIEKEVTDEAL